MADTTDLRAARYQQLLVDHWPEEYEFIITPNPIE
jgi:hypothetical protein